MNEDISCFDCKYYDGICCMKNCRCMAILHEDETAGACENYVVGKYDADELDRTNYK